MPSYHKDSPVDGAKKAVNNATTEDDDNHASRPTPPHKIAKSSDLLVKPDSTVWGCARGWGVV